MYLKNSLISPTKRVTHLKLKRADAALYSTAPDPKSFLH